MRLWLLLFLFFFVTSIKLPIHFQILSREMKNANLLGASSCIKTVSFLVSRFTKLSMLESEEKLGSYKQKYEFPKVIHQDLDKLKFLESILTNQSIKRFIGIIVDVLGKITFLLKRKAIIRFNYFNLSRIYILYGNRFPYHRCIHLINF